MRLKQASSWTTDRTAVNYELQSRLINLSRSSPSSTKKNQQCCCSLSENRLLQSVQQPCVQKQAILLSMCFGTLEGIRKIHHYFRAMFIWQGFFQKPEPALPDVRSSKHFSLLLGKPADPGDR